MSMSVKNENIWQHQKLREYIKAYLLVISEWVFLVGLNLLCWKKMVHLLPLNVRQYDKAE